MHVRYSTTAQHGAAKPELNISSIKDIAKRCIIIINVGSFVQKIINLCPRKYIETETGPKVNQEVRKNIRMYGNCCGELKYMGKTTRLMVSIH